MKAIALLALLLVFMSLGANLVEKQPTVYTQPDGTTLSLFVSGDEYYHRVHDANGYTILQHPQTGFAVYAIPDGNTIKASEYRVGTVDPATLGIRPNLLKDLSSAIALRDEVQHSRDAGNKASPTGTFNNLMAFVRFSDQTNFPSVPTYATYNNNFSSTTQQSLADYYDEVSSGQLDINSYLYPSPNIYGAVLSYQVTHTRGYYAPYNASTNPTGYSTTTEAQNRRRALVTELIGYMNPDIPDGLDTDTDGDGIIDGIMFLFRGLTDDWGDLLWPAHWSGSYVCGTINGADVNHYIFEFEGSAPPTGVSVLCHEMGHMIGFPDLYHYTNNGITPVGAWTLMSNDNAQHETVYEKLKYGTWFSSIPTITPTTTPTTYTLDSIDTNPYDAYKILSSSANQFYVVEYRRDTGRYESGIPASGLIVYRIIDTFAAADVVGNADGPPDEIYIYRPGGDIDTDGTINSANFSSTVSRTRIHNDVNPEPWLFSDASTQLDGNLVITDVGASGGTTITFTLRDSAPNIWDGSSSTNWATPANWSLNHVPTVDEDVEIPSLIARYPILTASQGCRSLLVESGASVSMSSFSMTVYNNYTNFGSLIMDNASGNLTVGKDLYFDTGSSATISAYAHIYVQSDIEFRTGSNVNMASGVVTFYGIGASYFRTYAAATINVFISDKDSPYISGFSAVTSAILTITGNLYVYSGSTLTHPYTGTTILKGGMYVYTGSTCSFGSGTLNLQGNTTVSLYLEETTAYLNSLTINKGSAYSVSLSFPITVKGNLTITTGILNCNAKTITLGGSWTNSVGASSFVETSGTVVINGTGTQTLSTETFNILQLNKTAGYMSIPTGSTVTAASYDWVAGAYTVSGGTFTVYDLVDPGILGTITLITGTINYTQDAAQYIDLRATLTINGGTFNVYGGSGSMWFSYIDIATLNMSSGILDIKAQSIYISNSIVFNENITGGTIRTPYYFQCVRGDFTPTGGTLEMYGGTDALLYLATGSNLYNLVVNKTSGRETKSLGTAEFITEHDGTTVPVTRSNTVVASGNILVTNTFTLTAGTFDVAAMTITVYNDLLIYGTLKMITAGVLDVGDDVAWNPTSVSNVTAGNIYCGGNWFFYAGCTADLTGSTTTLDNAYGGSLTINTITPRFGNLVIAGTEEDPVTTYYYYTTSVLYVNGNLTINATNTLNLNEGVCTIAGITNIADTGTVQVGDGGTLTIYGGLDLHGNLFTGPGTCTIHGYLNTFATGLLSVVSGEFINDAPWDTGGGNVIYFYCGMIISNGNLEITDKSVSIAAHATRTFSNAYIYVGVGFSATALNAYQPTGGGLYLIGTHNPALDISGGNWASNLYIMKTNSTNGVYLQNPITITGVMSLTGGKLYTNSLAMTVGGAWTNTAGASAFVPGTGTVTFNQAGTVQIVNNANNFYNVTDSHTGMMLYFTGNTVISGTLTVGNIVAMEAGATLGTVLNTVSTGVLAFYNNFLYSMTTYTGGGALNSFTSSHVNIADLTQNGLYGSFISDAGHLEFHQDAGNWIDLNGNMNILNNGIVDIYGGSMDCYMAYNGNSVFTMSSGQFNVKNFGFYIYNNTHTGDFQISGGTMHLAGSWTDSWGIFDPTGGTVEFTGTSDAVINAHASSWFWAVNVNKPFTRDALEPDFTTDHAGNTTPITRTCNLTIGACTIKAGYIQTAANLVYLAGTLTSLNAGNITLNNGVFRLNGYTLTSTGNINVNSTMVLDPLSILQISNAKTIDVNNGGTLLSVGNVANNAMITHNSTGYYGINIKNGGTLGAQYTIFEYMNSSGVYLQSGSMVDTSNKLDYCTFRLGAASGRLLWINNGQSFTVTGAVFPSNTWSGAYNVSKTVNSGIVYFASWTGGFGGPTFEQDAYNHIYWQGYGNPPITDMHISYISGTNRVQLDWTYPFAATSYKIYRSTNPYGTFTYYASSTTNTWSQVVPGLRYYYRVTAMMP